MRRPREAKPRGLRDGDDTTGPTGGVTMGLRLHDEDDLGPVFAGDEEDAPDDELAELDDEELDEDDDDLFDDEDDEDFLDEDDEEEDDDEDEDDDMEGDG